jgi:hypothetical protein
MLFSIGSRRMASAGEDGRRLGGVSAIDVLFRRRFAYWTLLKSRSFTSFRMTSLLGVKDYYNLQDDKSSGC